MTDVLAPVIDSYQAVADVPIPALYRELFARYPEANSCSSTATRPTGSNRRLEAPPGDFQPYVKTVHWTTSAEPRRLRNSDAELVWMHGQHTTEVTAFFREVAPDKLGVFDLYVPA